AVERQRLAAAPVVRRQQHAVGADHVADRHAVLDALEGHLPARAPGLRIDADDVLRREVDELPPLAVAAQHGRRVAGRVIDALPEDGAAEAVEGDQATAGRPDLDDEAAPIDEWRAGVAPGRHAGAHVLDGVDGPEDATRGGVEAVEVTDGAEDVDAP